MNKWSWIVSVFLLFSLSACGGTPDPAITMNPSTSTTTPEQVMQQMLTALDQGDIVTIDSLLDPNMPYRDVTITNGLRLWKDRRRDFDQNPWADVLGPAVKTTIEPVEQRGQTTHIRAVIEHKYGVSDLTLMLKATSDGYQVANWDTTIVKPSR